MLMKARKLVLSNAVVVLALVCSVLTWAGCESISGLPQSPDFTPENDSPSAFGESYTVLMGQSLDVTATDGLLRNDAGGLSVTPFVAVTDAGGLVVVQEDGAFRYMPPAEFVGADEFTYELMTDDESATGRVLLKVVSLESVPVP